MIANTFRSHAASLILSLPLWLFLPPVHADVIGNEAQVNSDDLSITLPVVHVLPDEYYRVALGAFGAGSSLSWRAIAAEPVRALQPENVTGTFNGTHLFLTCVIYGGNRFKATLRAAATSNGLELQLQALSKNDQCMILRPLDSVLSEELYTSQCAEETIVYNIDQWGLPQLESLPGAAATIYLDYDGGNFNGMPVTAYDRDRAALPFGAEEQNDIVCSWKRVAEAYAMFDVNVTTVDEVRAASAGWAWLVVGDGKTHAIASGLGYLNTFGRLPDAWAFVGSGIEWPEAILSYVVAHELGHIFGLNHQGIYFGGAFGGTNEPASRLRRTPIMSSQVSDIVAWRYGQHEGTNGENMLQDDVLQIRTKLIAVAGGDGYRPDDLQAARNDSTVVMGSPQYGVIERPGDKDVVAIQHAGGPLIVRVKPRGISSVDVVLAFYDDAGGVFAFPVDANAGGAEILDFEFLRAGRYFLEISGTATNSPYDSSGLAVLGAYALEVMPPESTRVSEISFKDSAMRTCVTETAEARGWHFVKDFTALRCEGEGISSASGIEYLTGLETLRLARNRLTTLQLGSNTKLRDIDAKGNRLVSLDVSNLTALKILDVGDNDLTSIDPSDNINLTRLNIGYNLLQTLDLSNHSQLYSIEATSNPLTTLVLPPTLPGTIIFLKGNMLTSQALEDVRNHAGVIAVVVE